MSNRTTVPPLSWKGVVRASQKKLARITAPARHDFATFVAEVGRDETGKPMQLDTYGKLTVAALSASLKAGRHFAQVSPPGLGKSTIARLFMLWRIGREPTLRTVATSGTLDGSETNVSLCRQILVTREFQSLFPEARPDYDRSMTTTKNAMGKDTRGWRSDSWFLRAAGQRKDPTMASVACIPQREDMRVDLLLADDIVTEQIAGSAAKHKAVANAFWSTWIEGRLSNGGRCVYLQNLRRQGDLAFTVRNDRRFVSMWVGVTLDCSAMFVRLYNAPPEVEAAVVAAGGDEIERVGPGEWHFALPPSRPKFNAEEFAAMNPRSRRQLYHLEPGAPEDAVNPQFERYRREGRLALGTPGASLGLVPAAPGLFLPPDLSWDRLDLEVIGGLDWSSGKRRGKALTFVARHRTTRQAAPVFHERVKGSVSDLVDLLNRLWGCGLKWRMIVAEDNCLQEQLNEVLREKAQPAWRYTVKDFSTLPGAKLDVLNGLPMLGTTLETGALLWYADASTFSPDWALLDTELTDTTHEQVSSPGRTPDGLMSLWFAMRHLTQTASGGSKGPARAVAPTPAAGPLRRF